MPTRKIGFRMIVVFAFIIVGAALTGILYASEYYECKYTVLPQEDRRAAKKPAVNSAGTSYTPTEISLDLFRCQKMMRRFDNFPKD